MPKTARGMLNLEIFPKRDAGAASSMPIEAGKDYSVVAKRRPAEKDRRAAPDNAGSSRRPIETFICYYSLHLISVRRLLVTEKTPGIRFAAM